MNHKAEFNQAKTEQNRFTNFPQPRREIVMETFCIDDHKHLNSDNKSSWSDKMGCGIAIGFHLWWLLTELRDEIRQILELSLFR